MKNIFKLLLPVMLIAPLVWSCDDMLDEVPSKQADIIPTKIEYLNGFFSHVEYKRVDLTPIMLLSDDYEPLKIFEDRSPNAYGRSEIQLPAVWNMYSIANFEYDLGPWGSYQEIYIANTILDYIPEVSGSEVEKLRTKGDAFFMRANAHFNLVNTYSLPYVQGGSNDHLGVMIRDNTSLSDYVNRSTVQECYDFIMSDLDQTEELLADIDLEMASIGSATQWRASYPAVCAFKANVYLTMGDFTKAAEYADKALSRLGVARLIDFNTELSYTSEAKYIIQEEEGVDKEVTVYSANVREVTFEPYHWKETLWRSSTFFRPDDAWLAPSQNLMSLYGDSDVSRMYDLRWKYLFTHNHSYANPAYQGGGTPFTPAVKIASYSGINADNNDDYHINLGPTVAELYLIKAECLARGGDFGAAQTIVNELRAKRMDATAPIDIINLSFADKDDAVKQILSERRREMPFVKRWFDIRRLAANNETAYLPGTLTREFYAVDEISVDPSTEVTYTFNATTDYKKLAFPLPKKDIIQAAVYGTDIKQNEYDTE